MMFLEQELHMGLSPVHEDILLAIHRREQAGERKCSVQDVERESKAE